MEASPVKRLYKYYGLLAEAAEQEDKILEHEDLYTRIIEARHGNAEEKRLAAQFIPKFLQHFPHLMNVAVSAQLDLCEDSDLVVRKQAVKEVTSLVRSRPICVKRVAYFIAQLLEAEDVGEGLLVRNTLIALFNVDPSLTLSGIFALIDDGNAKMRERCTTFLINRLGSLNKTLIDKMRRSLADELDLCLENSRSEEIAALLPLMSYAAETESSVDKTVVGFFERQLDIEKEHLKPVDEDVKRIYQFTKLAKTHLSKGVNSGKFVEFYCLHLLPILKELDGYSIGSGLPAAVLKQFNEIVHYCSELNDAENCYVAIFRALDDLLPPTTEDQSSISIHFTLLECLLGALIVIIDRVPPSFPSYETSLEQLRANLKLLARHVESYKKRLSEQEKEAASETTTVALKCLNNLTTLIRRLFLDPPKPVRNWISSWNETATIPSKKRKTSSSSVERVKKDPSKSRGIQQIYTPPGGKYSRSFKRYS